MPSPKSGKAGAAVTPAEPKMAEEADKANPGEVEQVKAEQQKTKTGKYGSEKVKPHKPPQTPEEKDSPAIEEEKEKKQSWIEIELVDEEGNPVPGVAYKVTLPDGETVAEGTLDDKGFARVDGIEPGSCKVTFPGLDNKAWKNA